MNDDRSDACHATPMPLAAGAAPRPVAPDGAGAATRNALRVVIPPHAQLTARRKLDRSAEKRAHGLDWVTGALRPGQLDPAQLAGAAAGLVASARAGAHAVTSGLDALPAGAVAALGAITGAVF